MNRDLKFNSDLAAPFMKQGLYCCILQFLNSVRKFSSLSSQSLAQNITNMKSILIKQQIHDYCLGSYHLRILLLQKCLNHKIWQYRSNLLGIWQLDFLRIFFCNKDFDNVLGGNFELESKFLKKKKTTGFLD